MENNLLDFTDARAAGDAALVTVAENAGEDFMVRAREFVLDFLKRGPTPGEELTEACKAAGIKPHNDKAFGAVYCGLSRDKLIVFAGECPRRKGHGCRGGSIWRLA